MLGGIAGRWRSHGASGVVLTETTIRQSPFNIEGTPVAFRARKAIQYGDNIDKVVEYLGTAEETDRIWYTEFPEPHDGYWQPYADRPGLGLELSPDAVRRYAI